MKKLITLILILLHICCLSACSSKSNVELSEYINYELNGSNGKGEVSYTIDYAKLDELIGDDQLYKSLKKLCPELYNKKLDSSKGISITDLIEIVTESNLSELSNGDEINFYVNKNPKVTDYELNDIENELGIKFKNYNLKISELKEPVYIDFYSIIKEYGVSFKGTENYNMSFTILTDFKDAVELYKDETITITYKPDYIRPTAEVYLNNKSEDNRVGVLIYASNWVSIERSCVNGDDFCFGLVESANNQWNSYHSALGYLEKLGYYPLGEELHIVVSGLEKQ